MIKKRIMLIISALLLLATYLSIFYMYHPLNNYNLIQAPRKEELNLEYSAMIENVTGNCTSGISNLYTFENSTIDLFSNTKNYTKMVRSNISLNNLNFGNLTVTKITTAITALTDPFEEYSIANDTSKAMNGTDQNVLKLAQFFTINNICHIDKFYFYLNHSNIGNLTGYGVAGIVLINIYKQGDLEGTRINQNDMVFYLPDYEGNWFNYTYFALFNNLLVKGNYSAVFQIQNFAMIRPVNNNSWQIQNYTALSEDKGQSLMKNSSGQWNPIADDGHADFLFWMSIANYTDPNEVNLTFSIDNQVVNFNTYKDENPAYNKFPWTSYSEYHLPDKPSNDLNFTLTFNRTLGLGVIMNTFRFNIAVNTSGTYLVSSNSRKWAINYTSVNSTSGIFPIFTFPADWTVTKFYNRFDQEVIEYGILYSKIYNQIFMGIYYPDVGNGQTTFNLSAEFSSFNYINKINPQILAGNDFQTELSFYKGETLRIQAIIQDTENKPVNDGNCSFYIYDPSNQIIHSENTNVTNGTAISNNKSTNNWIPGYYSVIVTWVNGSEVGFGSFIFSIQDEIIPFLPLPPEQPIWLYILATAFTVSMVAVGGMIVRRKLQERNWEKSLLHLFIMSKEGLSMYNYPFGIESKDPTLISGMLTAISSFVKETTGSKKQLKVIDQEDKKVILGYGQYATVVVLSEKNLPIIHNKATKFLKDFESNYGPKIVKWDGAMEVFKGVNKIVEKYFPVSVETKIIQGVGREILELKERILSTSNPQEILQLLQKTTELTERYKDIIRENFNKEYGEILKIANDKIQSSG